MLTTMARRGAATAVTEAYYTQQCKKKKTQTFCEPFSRALARSLARRVFIIHGNCHFAMCLYAMMWLDGGIGKTKSFYTYVYILNIISQFSNFYLWKFV